MNKFKKTVYAAGAASLIAGISGCISVAPPDTGELSSRSAVSASNAEASSEALPQQPQLQDYLRYAALHNPAMESAYYQWQAALLRVPQATALPEPTVSYSYFIKEVETRVGAQNHRLSAMQMIPWLEKLRLKGEKAASVALEKRYQYEETKLGEFFTVKKNYYELYYLKQAVAILQENTDLLQDLEAVLRRQYAAGTAQNAALIQVQNELGKLEDRLKSLQALQPALAARLNAAIGREPSAPLPWPDVLRDEAPALEYNELIAHILRKNPKLSEARQREQTAQTARKLARQQFAPDFGVGFSYTQTDEREDADPDENGKDPLMFTVQMTIPWWFGKYSAAVDEAEALQAASARKRHDLTNRLAADLQTALFDYQDAKRKLNLFEETLIPKGEQAYQTLRTAFTAGNASYLDLLDAERTLLEFRLLAERARVDRMIRLAQLEKLTASDLSDQPAGD